jgi:sigma-B regulation protein RsbQ
MTDILARHNVKLSGSGPQTLIFAHGFGCDQNMWWRVAPAFASDFRVVQFDYVGCGKADRTAYDPRRYATLDGYASDVIEICHALAITNAVFVGHSVSATIGILASNREPSLFEKLVLVGPSPRYINDPPAYVGGFDREDVDGLLSLMEQNYLGWANAMARVAMGVPDQPELAAELEESFCSTDPECAIGFARATFLSDNRRDLASVRVPTLIIQCADDAISPVAVGEYVRDAIAKSELVVLAATGHCPHISHSRETIREIRRFLAAHSPGERSAA